MRRPTDQTGAQQSSRGDDQGRHSDARRPHSEATIDESSGLGSSGVSYGAHVFLGEVWAKVSVALGSGFTSGKFNLTLKADAAGRVAVSERSFRGG